MEISPSINSCPLIRTIKDYIDSQLIQLRAALKPQRAAHLCTCLPSMFALTIDKLLLFAIASLTGILATNDVRRDTSTQFPVFSCESELVHGLTAKVVSSSDGTRIYGEATGDPSKPHLVFVHGFSLSASVFNRIFYNPIYQERFYLVRIQRFLN